MYDPELVSLPPNVGVPAENEPPARKTGIARQLAAGMDMNGWRKHWAAHLALVSYADSLVGEFIERLKEKGVYDDTVVVFTTDHGEHLGQHDMYQKFELYEQCINIPLIIKSPGRGPAVRREVVSHIDVTPTLCELLGLPKPERLDGISLVPALDGRPVEDDRAIFLNWTISPQADDIRRGLVNAGYKYIEDERGGRELYDLKNDPLERINLAGEKKHAGIVSAFATRCGEFFH